MVKKYCPRCGEYSYSACAEGRWLCPICGFDLSKMPVLQINESYPGASKDSAKKNIDRT